MILSIYMHGNTEILKTCLNFAYLTFFCKLLETECKKCKSNLYFVKGHNRISCNNNIYSWLIPWNHLGIIVNNNSDMTKGIN